MKFTHWLQNRMHTKGLCYAQLAARTGLHATTISDIIKSQRDVRLSTFIALCDGLDADPAKVLRELRK